LQDNELDARAARIRELEALEVEARHYAQGRLDKLHDRLATATALLREERDALQDRYDLLTTEIAQGPDLIGRMRRERDAANARCSELEDLLEVARVYVRFAEGEGVEIDGLDDRIDALLGKK
jgi:chromosome segregation ATPase